MPAHSQFLPGVVREGPRPVVRCDSKRVIQDARRRAVLREAVQLLLLLVVDVFCARFPMTHVPLLSRVQSLDLVALFNVALAAHVILGRTFPRWKARRVATTWSVTERQRFGG
jgi:hypothetical protein